MKRKIFYLTKKGLERIKKEYERLMKIKKEKSKGKFPEILHSDDLNLEYLIFKEDMEFLESRLRELEYILKNYELILPPPKEKRNVVQLGATVTLQEPDGQINEFMIVGPLEANPNEGKISCESPVGKSLLGRKIGDEVAITSPICIVYKIKKISYKLT